MNFASGTQVFSLVQQKNTFFVVNNRFFRNIFKPGRLPLPPDLPREAASRIRRRLRGTAAAVRGTAAAVRGTAAAASSAVATENIFDVFYVFRRFKGFRTFPSVFGRFWLFFGRFPRRRIREAASRGGSRGGGSPPRSVVTIIRELLFFTNVH